MHTFLCVDSTLCVVVCYYTAFCLGLAFTVALIYMYIDT